MFIFWTDKSDDLQNIYVGDTSPLWCCKYAMRTDNACVFCICNDCYKTKDITRGKRKRCDMYADTCDHDNLDPYNDSTYFTPTYLKHCCEKNSYTPSQCSKCLRQLTSVKQFVCL